MSDPAALIERLALAPHPEGGWYRETMREAAPGGGRGLATAILYLLEKGERSHWHRVDAVELWLWHAGAPLTLLIDDGQHHEHLLGNNVLAGQTPQAVVPAGAWQSAEAQTGWALVSCVVTPAFEFSGFELAPAGWAPR
ncbi:cupin domain-containing protein [Sphingomonas sp. So64.6b]|uniref:cupin domain-containing protein n=1 Tax=Sphingomonas sp. So64.6b TaxID=2997354 RepID=UPI0015FF189D|nr:cupin domain-containing protein [Sphingomonas sp. So64.6b]QNA83544.1 cupin domain-containing protein [Sphingomonas sp. So64.6b]